MSKLSVIVICCNEEAILDKSLSAVQWADEMVVVDSFSTDQTLRVAERYTDRVYQHAWEGYGRQKNLAMQYASGPWVLSLDADEVVSPELAGEIRAVLAEESRHAGYRIPRMSCYLGRLLRHAWYPDYKLRLFRKGRVRWGEEMVHESMVLDGSAGRLLHPILHYSFPSVRDHLETIQRYTTLGAEDLAQSGRAFSLVRLLGSPVALFVKQFFLKRGFLDGIPGLIACVLSGVHEFVKYAKLYELRKRGNRHTDLLPPPAERI